MLYNRFHATCSEDFLIRHRGILPVDKGVFVDIGAGPPQDGNNTCHFERSGWTGLCVDAHPRVVENIHRERTCIVEHCAVGTEEGEVKFFIHGDINLSSKLPGRGNLGEIKVPAARLETLLVKHRIAKIDLLSIDAEGCDLDVWKSMDWLIHRPTVVIIEPGDDKWLIMEEMFSKGYNLEATTIDNLIFKSNFEWQFVGEGHWIYGPKIRGMVRPALGEIDFDRGRDGPEGGWVWFTQCLKDEKRGVAINRPRAVFEVERALGDINERF